MLLWAWRRPPTKIRRISFQNEQKKSKYPQSLQYFNRWQQQIDAVQIF